MKEKFTDTGIRFSRQTGFSILEVVIGIFIFVVGLLALSALQGALTRSMADAKARTTAVNIAERVIESQRGFTRLISDTVEPKSWFAFNDIVSKEAAEPTLYNGVLYTVDMDVTDYYYFLDGDNFCTVGDADCPTDAPSPTYKQLEVTVTWDAAREFRGDDGLELDAVDDLGTGSVVLTTTIPALVTSASARVADESVFNAVAPLISYTPGANPDIVSLSLGDNKFKESLLPEPDVQRRDELVETRFDVITYSQSDAGAQFLRREEFASVSCECTLKAPDETNPGHRPVIWAGDEYVRGQHAKKAYGVSATPTQSPLCDACCLDHHDGGAPVAGEVADHADAAVNTFVPFKPKTGPLSERVTGGPFAGDHKHYSRPRTGPPVEVTTAGSNYVESCRMVRVDGFFRVAQDFRREDLNIFPEDFLNDESEIDVYSAYVTGAASDYANYAIGDYETSPPCIGPPLALPEISCEVPTAPKQAPYPALVDLGLGEFPSWTTLPLITAETQQLRSRGVYIDYLTSDLRTVLANCDPATETADDEDCKSGDIELDKTGSVNHLEMLPFYDVQMTKLNRWNERPTPNVPVDTTNEPLANNNTHTRGVASKSADGESYVRATGHRGNIGFTDTLPIDPTYDSEVTYAELKVHAGVVTPLPVGTTISGTLTETVPGDPPIVVTGLNGVLCGQTSVSYSCLVPLFTADPKVDITGYGKEGKIRWACSTSISPLLPLSYFFVTPDGADAKATFNLFGVPAGTEYNLVIQNEGCTF